MSADAQAVIAAGVVAAAALYVARATWRVWAGKKTGCGQGCGKCTTAAAPPPPGGRISLPQV